MRSIEKIENSIEEKDFDSISKLMFHSLYIKRDYKSHNYINKKEELLVYFTEFLEKYLELEIVNNKKQKLEIINLIDKMNLQKELLDLQKGISNLSEIQAAGKHLGSKSQSAFKTKL